MKDYYDIYYLANKFDFNGIILTKALQKYLKIVVILLLWINLNRL